ncbi:MAG: FG-GAP-like repeat-containing protein [Gammaproteobacteria bacterium]
MGIAGNGITQDNDPVTPVGILVNSSRNVEIANSEIYGWSGIAIKVKDERDRSDASNWAGVWIHDNYIHHNQRYRHEGYGVQAHDGAHVLIERNVFDYNRHSLEASGAPGTGYRAYNNRVGPNGGVNSLVTHTHAVDVHGTSDCDGYDAYCGDAGEFFDYRHNALWYTAGDVLKVRGEPSIGGHVIANVFAKDQGFGAITQTEGTNLWDWDPATHYSVSNQYNASATLSSTVCDFDGDGWADDFEATGTNWWYKSGATGQYFYLATSPNKTGSDIAPSDVNGDGRCDVTDSSGVYVNRSIPGGGATARLTAAAKRGDIIATKPYTGPNTPGSVRMWQVSPDLTGISSDKTVDWRIRLDGGPEPLENGMLLAVGDVNADGAPDLLWRSENSNQVAVTLLDDNGDVRSPAESHLRSISTASQLRGTIESDTQFAGLGDFNGDGRADILWRTSTGQLWMWPAGQQANKVRVNYHRNVEVDEPVPAEWQIKGIGDFNGDGYDDIQWRWVKDDPSRGQVVIWYLQGNTMMGDLWTAGPDTCRCWEIQQIADFDGDGRDDTLWRSNTNHLAIWFQGRYEAGQAYPTFNGLLPGADWHIVGAGDFTADGKADILWRNDNGTAVIWKMNGGSYAGQSDGLALDTAWNVRGALTQAHHRMSLN